MSIARHHAEWLSLLEISGPFLSLPVLLRAFPQGLDSADAGLNAELRLAYDEWLDNQGGLHPDPEIHRAWANWVLGRLLNLPPQALLATPPLPSLTIRVAEESETLRPDLTLVEPGAPDRVRLLVQIYPPAVNLEGRLPGSRWSASPATRMMTLLRASGVRLGLVTNGERWMLVDAPADGTTGFTSWYAALWLEEPLTLRAFRSLLSAYRFFGVPDNETLPHLLTASIADQQEVTDQLGLQVRAAVEVLLQALDRADRDAGGRLLQALPPEQLYEAALKVMMRLVFLLCAEERGMLPLDDPFYGQNYAVSTLQAQLREAADQAGEEVLEHRHDAWSRLLATFRAVHGGIRHDRLTLPAYGGSLFDPDALPFLEGRTAGADWQSAAAHPLPVDNRTVLHLLEALQILQVRLSGGSAEARRLSFRALDIEQIGHVYEGLLDHTARRAAEPILGLAGAKGQEPEIPLSRLETPAAKNETALLDFLQETTGRSESALRKLLGSAPETVDPRLRSACGNDAALLQRLLPFAGLLREDSYGRPVVIRSGSLYVTSGNTRRATGTHYTPRALTEPIVAHTLEPQVYRGPAEGLPREQWSLRPPEEILALRVCDMAMGSGAFLVQACRYLSEHLVESWEREPGNSDPAPLREAATAEERLAVARRLVADRCLYGVDKNPLAVEMAKLSLWLITLDRGRPFTFLDHALKSGDSIVGVGIDQLTCWNLEGKGDRQWITDDLYSDIQTMIGLRQEIEATPIVDIRDQKHKAYLLTRADALAHDLKTGADMLIGAYYTPLPEAQRAPLRDALLAAFRKGQSLTPEEAAAADLAGLRPFHWELEFPEIFNDDRPGFDAFVGNPPFIGGRRIRETLGDRYRDLLYSLYAGSSGNADYSAFFFLRAFELLRPGGTLGLIATNTIAQGDTRLTGLDNILARGGTIYRADNNAPWPGEAAVVVDVVHIARGKMEPPLVLDNNHVSYISSFLNNRQSLGEPYALTENDGKSHMGSNVVGLGFVLSPQEAEDLIIKNPLNKDVLFPYLNGEDLNSRPDQSPSRWIINFFDWPLEKAEQYPDCMDIIKTKVYPERKSKEGSYAKLWWQYGRRQERLYEAIAPLKQVLIRSRVSSTHAPVFVPVGWIYSEATIVFAFDDYFRFAVIQSSSHECWVRQYASTLKGDTRYSPTDVFENFPFPNSSNTKSLELLGEQYHEHRHQIMISRQKGLTATYNRFHNPQETAADIARLRELHIAMDQAVASAYGWANLDLGHGFHETPQGVRYTLSEPARREVLDRLLALNHQRHEEEVKAQEATALKPAGKSGGKKNRPSKPEPPAMERLF